MAMGVRHTGPLRSSRRSRPSMGLRAGRKGVAVSASGMTGSDTHLGGKGACPPCAAGCKLNTMQSCELHEQFNTTISEICKAHQVAAHHLASKLPCIIRLACITGGQSAPVQ